MAIPLPKSPPGARFYRPQAIDHFVMAITSVDAGVGHGGLTTPGISRPHQRGELVMMTMLTIALFAMALAFPGLITAVMSRAAAA
jgi:hypothetical protein